MKPHPDDKLFNRRIMAYGGLIFSAFWVMQVFWVDVLLHAMETAKVIAYLGVPPTLAGLGFWQYLKAAAKDDSSRNN